MICGVSVFYRGRLSIKVPVYSFLLHNPNSETADTQSQTQLTVELQLMSLQLLCPQETVEMKGILSWLVLLIIFHFRIDRESPFQKGKTPLHVCMKTDGSALCFVLALGCSSVRLLRRAISLILVFLWCDSIGRLNLKFVLALNEDNKFNLLKIFSKSVQSRITAFKR